MKIFPNFHSFELSCSNSIDNQTMTMTLTSYVVMCRTPFYQTSIEHEHHFSNIDRTRTSFFEHRTNSNMFINHKSNIDRTSNEHQTFSLF